MKTYLSVKQVVARLNGSVSVKLVYKLIAQGKLRANRATGKVLVEEESLVELMEGTPERQAVEKPTTPHRRRRRKRPEQAELW